MAGAVLTMENQVGFEFKPTNDRNPKHHKGSRHDGYVRAGS